MGKFRACKPAGDIELRSLTLIYTEKGRGKTLYDIFRSLRSGEAAYIRSRATLGPTATPTVNIRLDGSNSSFDGTTWSTTPPELRIFDAIDAPELDLEAWGMVCLIAYL